MSPRQVDDTGSSSLKMMRWISGGIVVRVDFPVTITNEAESLYC